MEPKETFESVGAGDPVHLDEQAGGWFYWTEMWADRNGPFPTEAEARYWLHRYCEEELGILPYELQQ